MQALEITAARPEEAWALLGEDAHFYGDNGGDADGSSYLPCEPDAMDPERIDAALAAGVGVLREVRFATDDGMAHLGGLVSCDWTDPDQMTALLVGAADTQTEGWAHFGAYGALDSRWVFIPQSEEV